MISPQQASAILQFLANTQIKGADAPLFMECILALQAHVTTSEPHKENGADSDAGPAGV